MPKRTIYCAVLCALLFVIPINVLGESQANDERPDVFSHENVTIEAGRTIERLLVANADASVTGAVREGIIVVDGNLTINSGAYVGGRVIVLGGRLVEESGSHLQNAVWVVAPGNFSFTKVAVGVLLVLTCAGLVLAPYIIWEISYLLRKFPLYLRLKQWLLTIQRRWPLLYIAITLSVSGLMLVLFAELAWETIFRHTMGIFDNAFIWLIRYFSSPGMDRAMIATTNLGFGYTYGVLVLGSFIVLALLRRWIEIKGLGVCLLGGALLNEVLKHLFERARPSATWLVEASGYSFPSGHAMVSLCFYGMIAFLITRKISSWHVRILVTITAALLVSAIGVSRIYLGVHYPSDVIAGYSAGATWLAFSISLLMLWERNLLKTEK